MWQVIGQDKAVSFLRRSLETGKLAHAYLLVGPPHVGKMTLALNLAQALNCEAAERPCLKCASCLKIAGGGHADVQVIGLDQNGDGAEAKLIGIDQMKQVLHSASLPPFEGACKVFIIESAELLSMEAANCLLKTLEEPEAKVIFVLLATNDRLLPATVVSRCQRLELPPLAITVAAEALTSKGIEAGRARLLAGLSHGRLGWAILADGDEGLLQQRGEEMDKLTSVLNGDSEARFAYAAGLATRFVQNRTLVNGVLELWLDYWCDLMLVKAGCPELITNIDRRDGLAATAAGYRLEQIRAFIESLRAAGEQLRQNANPRLVLEVLMLDIPKKEGRENALPVVKYG